MEGYLRKQDHKALVKGWKKRYFKIQGQLLVYYKEQTAKDPIDQILLSGAKIYEDPSIDKKLEGLTLIVETPARQYVLATDSKQETARWVDSLKKAGRGQQLNLRPLPSSLPPPPPNPTASSASSNSPSNSTSNSSVQSSNSSSYNSSYSSSAPIKADFADEMAKLMQDSMMEEQNRNDNDVVPSVPSSMASSTVLSAPKSRNFTKSRNAQNISKLLASASIEEALASNADVQSLDDLISEVKEQVNEQSKDQSKDYPKEQIRERPKERPKGQSFEQSNESSTDSNSSSQLQLQSQSQPQSQLQPSNPRSSNEMNPIEASPNFSNPDKQSILKKDTNRSQFLGRTKTVGIQDNPNATPKDNNASSSTGSTLNASNGNIAVGGPKMRAKSRAPTQTTAGNELAENFNTNKVIVPLSDGEVISSNVRALATSTRRSHFFGSQREEDFFHLHKDEQGYYLLEIPWQLKCFLRRLEEEGKKEEMVKISLQGLLLEQQEGVWTVNLKGYHTLGPRTQEPFAGDEAECLFRLPGDVTVRYNRGKWELLEAFIAESIEARVIQEQTMPTISYKIRNYKSLPSDARAYLSQLDDAVDQVNQHFEKEVSMSNFIMAGDQSQDAEIGPLIAHNLVTAIGRVFTHGFNATKGFFGGKFHLWNFIESYLERTSFKTLTGLGTSKCIREINRVFGSEETDQKLQAFVAHALNSKQLHEYIRIVANNDEAVERFYQPTAIIRIPALLNELVNSLEPLTVFPFRLHAGFDADRLDAPAEASLPPLAEVLAALRAPTAHDDYDVDDPPTNSFAPFEPLKPVSDSNPASLSSPPNPNNNAETNKVADTSSATPKQSTQGTSDSGWFGSVTKIAGSWFS